MLGRTGFKVSTMGLGAGGPSRLGVRSGRTEEESCRVVCAALDLGITLFDTSESYGTEALLGKALRQVKREDVVICTKLHGGIDGRAKKEREVEATLDRSLLHLGTDYIDVYMMHAIGAKRYDAIAVPLLPSLQKMKDKGKIRAIGITECFGVDSGHKMLQRALADDAYDVIMVGFNMLNTSARETVLGKARAQHVGVLDMFAVRKALRDISTLRDYLKAHVSSQAFASDGMALIDVIQSALEEGVCESLTEIAYRYCLSASGVDCILTGTGSENHLRANAAAVEKGPLPAQLVDTITKCSAGWQDLTAQ